MAVCTVSFGVTGYSLPWDQVELYVRAVVDAVIEGRNQSVDQLVRSVAGEDEYVEVEEDDTKA